jgi:prephenate dehydrogenase
MKDLDGFTIAIAGLGLMGGSLAMALKKHGVGRLRLGADVNPFALSRALELGVIDAAVEDYSKVDLFVLAMPVRGILHWLHTVGMTLPATCVVMDLGSTKQEIVAAMSQLTAHCIGGHPMCGKETSGIEAADAELFHAAKFVLTPLGGIPSPSADFVPQQRWRGGIVSRAAVRGSGEVAPAAAASAAALDAALALVARIGAQPIVMDAVEHDRAVAAISHVPYLLSAALVNCVDDLHDEHARTLAASGFDSMTRLAASDLRMMDDIIATNKDSIIELLDRYDRELRELREALGASDESRWRARLERAHNLKRGM